MRECLADDDELIDMAQVRETEHSKKRIRKPRLRIIENAQLNVGKDMVIWFNETGTSTECASAL